MRRQHGTEARTRPEGLGEDGEGGIHCRGRGQEGGIDNPEVLDVVAPAPGIEDGSSRVRAEAKGAALVLDGVDTALVNESDRETGAADVADEAPHELPVGPGVAGPPIEADAARAVDGDTVLRQGEILRHQPEVDAPLRDRGREPAKKRIRASAEHLGFDLAAALHRAEGPAAGPSLV